MEIIFWLTALLFLLNYFVYPTVIIITSILINDDHDKFINDRSYQPIVSLIIAAYNEEKVIRQKIINSLALNYPLKHLDIIIVSDGSDDRTHDIALEFRDKGINALHRPEREGKSAALNRAVKHALGEIVVFSDANNDFNEDSIQLLVHHFADDRIGAVTGAKHVYDDSAREASKGDNLYWKYEAAIKKAESRLGSITSGDGEIFAVRKSLFNPIDTSMINDDASITFDLVKQNYRVIYEANAESYEKASEDLIDDFNVKVRMTAGGFQTIVAESSFLFPPRNWFAIRFILHKLLRWLAPVFLVSIYLTALFLLTEPFYFIVFILQTVFYGLSLYGWAERKKSELPSFIYIPMYFSAMNLALAAGLYRFIKGQQNVQWQKAKR